MMNFSLPKFWLAALLATLVAALTVPSVLAHASLLRSDPADNSILTEPPQQVRLWFDETISADFSSAQLLDINGQPVEGVTISVDPAENLLILTPPELQEGLYSVRWRVLSEADGHFTQGLLVFGLGEGLNPQTVATVPTEETVPLPEVWLRWLNFTTLLTLVGSVAMAYLVLKPTGLPDSSINRVRQAAQRRVLASATIFSGLALLVGLGLFGWQLLALLNTLPEGAPIWGVGGQLLGGSRWGGFWLARQAVLLMLLGLLFWLYHNQSHSRTTGSRRGRLVLSTTALLLLALVVIQASSGHAAALSKLTPLAVAVDALHLLAASLWMGGLMALLIGLLPLLSRNRVDFTALARMTLGPFSRWATLSVVLLVATGLYNTGRQIASLDALVETLYGQALLTKVGLMLVAGMFGALNSIVLHPGLMAPLARELSLPPGWIPLSPRRLPHLVALEACLGLLVIATTGVLTAAPPARGPEFEVAAEDIPTVLDQTVGDMLITFAAKPNRPGQNVFTMRAASSLRPVPAEIMRVIVRFTYLGQKMGRASADAVEIEPGLYQVGGNYLSLAGDWQVEVVVRRKGIEDSVAQFHWVVAPPGPARLVVISKRPLQPITTATAGIIGLLLLLAVSAWAGRPKLKRVWPTATLILRPGQNSKGEHDETASEDDVETGAGVIGPQQSGAGWV